MKVIIDIPDDVIAEKSYCKYFGCLSTKLLEIIENSIPVNTDGDTISRSVLQEIWELYEKYQPSLATNVYEFGVALKGIIDNARFVAKKSQAQI